MIKILNDSNLGKNIQRLRINSKLTQAQTVTELQLMGSPLSRSTYSLIELGRCNIFVSDLVGLQKIFDVNFDEFFKDIPPSR